MSVKKIGIVGAGIFGCSIALELSEEGYDVTIIEKENDIMTMATKNNHNRIHYGYHYPRSIETAKQSLDSLISFKASYGNAISYGFDNYYSIAKEGSLTTAMEFIKFCNKVGISYKQAYPDKHLMNSDMLADSFLVEEPIYDWEILQKIVKEKLEKSNITLKLNSSLGSCTETFDFLINCTYSNINEISKFVGVPEIHFQKQDVIIPIFESNIKRTGLTVMDGPFCSVMPKGFESGKYLLYHAKYSIIEKSFKEELKLNSDIKKCTDLIISDAIRYFPFLEKVNFTSHWRTIRVIPKTNDDARITEIITYKENPNFISVFSGKVSTAVKIAKQISVGLKSGNFNSHI
jgi:hypothetical protein